MAFEEKSSFKCFEMFVDMTGRCLKDYSRYPCQSGGNRVMDRKVLDNIKLHLFVNIWGMSPVCVANNDFVGLFN